MSLNPDPMRYEISVVTTASDGVIDQAIDGLQRRIMDTSEEQTRQALIGLGWTPPDDRSLPLWTDAHFAALLPILAEQGVTNPTGFVRDIRKALAQKD